jgi:hypothetical protein
MTSAKPEAPGSKAPVGPVAAANKFYPKQALKPGGGTPDDSDPWRGNGIQTTGNGRVDTKGAVPVKEAKELPGDQGHKVAPHTKPGTDKENGTPAEMRKLESVDSTTALKHKGNKPKTRAGRVYPHLKQD